MQPDALEALFPRSVVTVSADAAELWDEPLHPGEADLIANAVASRRREFAAGRACAREALTRLGHAAVPLLRTPLRAPAWPGGTTGSITHCDAYCAAAAAHTREHRALGIDAERTGRVTARILERVTNETERNPPSGSNSDPAMPDWRTLVWCSKESALKCLATATGRMPTPREIAIELEPNAFRARLVSPALRALGVSELRGRTAVRGSLVLAGVTLPATHEPAASQHEPKRG